jgi:hypothetical protein
MNTSGEMMYKVLDLMNQSKCLDEITSSVYLKMLHIDKYLLYWEKTVLTITVLNYVFIGALLLQIIKFIHKTYLRIKNRNRNKEGNKILKQALTEGSSNIN